MTKTVYILRHAQSPMMGNDDFERPLSDKGFADMKALGSKMAADGLAPDYCHCSPAKRTRQTWRTITQSGVGEVQTDFPENQYNAPAGTLYETLTQKTDDRFSSVAMVAHNPGIYNLAVFLADKEKMPPELSMGYQAGTLTVLEFDVERWAEIMPESGTVTTILIPDQY